MSSIIVLGAGASLACAQHFHRKRRVKSNPPLDVDFFDRARELGLTPAASLRRYSERHAAISPFDHEAGNVRLEEFFRDVYVDLQNEIDPGVPKAYGELLDLYLTVIRRTTSWLCQDNRRGAPIGLLLDALAKDGPVVVITFNHDLVTENEIVKRRRLEGRWCITHGYGKISDRLTPTSVKGSASVFPNHSPGCEDRESITILKLHGSLNWYVATRGRLPSRSTLDGSGASELRLTKRRDVTGRFTYSKGTGRGRKTWYTWPVVVPPIHMKDRLISLQLNDVWADAERALKKASRIVFFGYSMPELDISAQRLFQRALRDNPNRLSLDVINPANEAAARYAGLVGTHAVYWCPNFETYRDRLTAS